MWSRLPYFIALSRKGISDAHVFIVTFSYVSIIVFIKKHSYVCYPFCMNDYVYLKSPILKEEIFENLIKLSNVTI